MFQFLIPAAIAAYSASRSSRAAKDAAATSAAATDRATELQREQFERQVELQEPWRQSGIAAQNRLLTLLGIDPNAQAGRAGAMGGGGLFGGIDIGSVLNAARPRTGLSVDPNDPNFGRYAKEFGMDQFQADPGYAFRLSEGMKALERSAAARGGLVSGATMKGLQRYGQELGSQEYTNAFNRYYQARAAALNPLQSLAGVGQTTSQQLGQAGANYATNVGNAMIGQGQTAANAMLARGSAYQRGAGDIASLAGRYYGGYGGYGGGAAPIYQASPSYMPVMDENLP
jgi:hypothetical protein